jgi:hypothetical protein
MAQLIRKSSCKQLLAMMSDQPFPFDLILTCHVVVSLAFDLTANWLLQTYITSISRQGLLSFHFVWLAFSWFYKQSRIWFSFSSKLTKEYINGWTVREFSRSCLMIVPFQEDAFQLAIAHWLLCWSDQCIILFSISRISHYSFRLLWRHTNLCTCSNQSQTPHTRTFDLVMYYTLEHLI